LPFVQAINFLVANLGVVLLTIDTLGLAILLTIHLCAFGGSQGSTIGGTFVSNLAMDSTFLALKAAGFTRSQRAVRNSLPDTLLLRSLTFTHFAPGVHVLGLRIMLLVINLFR
jgi:hypothetical protein